LSSSLQKNKNPKSVKKNTDEKDGEETEPEKAWAQPNPGSRTLTIIVFFQSRGIRKHRPKAFFPNTISKKEKRKQRGKRAGERVQKPGRQHQKQRKKKQPRRKGITSHRAFVFGAVLRCTGKFPFSACNKTFECSVKVI
jgi:hypothetical protein